MKRRRQELQRAETVSAERRQTVQREETEVTAGGDSSCREETYSAERRQKGRRDETCDRRCKEETGRAKK